MTRGDLVLVATSGPYSGKPRPALVVQSDLFNPTHASVTLCLLTSEVRNAPLFRVAVEPTAHNGLKKRSQVMVDKLFSSPAERLGDRIGALDAAALREVNEALRRWLDL